MDENADALDPIQKEYLAGFFAGLASTKQLPFAAPPSPEPSEPEVYGVPLSELSREERLKLERNPLDIWEQLVACAQTETPPDGGDVFRFKFHGLFYVAPAQDAFMLRVRMPGNVLWARQLVGLAEIADDWSGGYGDITTRGNIQLRELRPKHVVDVLMKLQHLGLIARGSGADNVRNITATPTAGFDPLELYDVRPLAEALQFYILNHRDLYGIPRKFNVSFDSGGTVSVVADTNDLAFCARRVGPGRAVPSGVYFRVLLAGITGHGQFAHDAGIALTPDECVLVAAAMLRVFVEHGDRTNRKKARLKYLIDRWGIERFLAETEQKLPFPLRRLAEDDCEPRAAVERHGHLGVHRQKQAGLASIGVAIPVGRLRSDEMRALAGIAETYGSGELRTTVWQNAIVPNVPEERVAAAQAAIVAAGFHYEASSIRGGVIACTGKSGCKFSATETKGQALALAAYLDPRIRLDRPINIHFTGCPNSCAQHYIGDIGLLGVNVTVGEESVDGYNVSVGGGTDHEQALGRGLVNGVPATELPALVERMLGTYQAARRDGESFTEFVRRHEIDELRSLFVARA